MAAELLPLKYAAKVQASSSIHLEMILPRSLADRQPAGPAEVILLCDKAGYFAGPRRRHGCVDLDYSRCAWSTEQPHRADAETDSVIFPVGSRGTRPTPGRAGSKKIGNANGRSTIPVGFG